MRMKKFAAVALLCLPGLALAGCGSKPAEADLHKTIEKALVDSGADAAQAKAYADCAAPKMHDELSADTLDKIMKDPNGEKMVKSDDKDAAEKIDKECTDKVLKNS